MPLSCLLNNAALFKQSPASFLFFFFFKHGTWHTLAFHGLIPPGVQIFIRLCEGALVQRCEGENMTEPRTAAWQWWSSEAGAAGLYCVVAGMCDACERGRRRNKSTVIRRFGFWDDAWMRQRRALWRNCKKTHLWIAKDLKQAFNSGTSLVATSNSVPGNKEVFYKSNKCLKLTPAMSLVVLYY